jgi:hypothetical protein
MFGGSNKGIGSDISKVTNDINKVVNVDMSSSTVSSVYGNSNSAYQADLALDGKFDTTFRTKCVENEWWSAKLVHRTSVTEVRIRNPSDSSF